MDNETQILGYVQCRTCSQPKAIKQGKGKRAAFVHGRCECGPDTRTGKAAQAEMKAFKSLEEVQADIEAINNPVVEAQPMAIEPEKETESKPKNETEPKPITTVKCVGIGAVLGLFFGGVIKTIKVVA
ncbi:hypothetical protein AB4077_19300 [Vibrio cyclitrophicus]|uniref:hypothetical protein n=1 Tax=Vibrio TaxID=662 RepID=UPI0002FDDB78|nr:MULTISPECIES: hypothetical protein [Vibrio]MCC4774990.1 hypothetical protein [Vibrio cyclitrophicus]MCC4844099.1 hypothetical protein [Vibrio cyclitrophicus]MCY9828606.1 hypothetical protein [Vibrio chagasii]MCY9866358.1 hypothetical protein [Vibrio coralliirubri]OED89226.1 hypothetical protein A141_14125 [Vibrio crassostreae ZF-91]